MYRENKRRPFAPVIILFVLLNGFFVAGKTMLTRWGADQSVLILGNLIVFAVTLLSYQLSFRGFKSVNPNAVVRSMYGSFLIKFFTCIVAAFIYIMVAKKNVNKPALFACMGLYLVYTFMEVSALTKLLKEKKNA